MMKYWIITLLIPLFSNENKSSIKSELVRLSLLTENDEDTQEIVEAAKECLTVCYARLAN